jgi:Cdc6-like AAA superfamily ATPase
MSVAIQILGLPGTGKTYSLRNLDAQSTYYINCDKKSMPFRGWKKAFNEENKNYARTSDPILIQKIIQGVSSSREDVKVVVIDTVNSIMSDKEMNERKKKGFDKWLDYAGDIYDLYSLANSEKLRDDLTVVFIGHVESYQDNFETRWRLKTGGAKLTKLNVESKLAYTFYSHAENTGDKIEYYFTTQTDGFNTARSPEGLFEYKIDNDLAPMIHAINDFEMGD